MTHNINDNISRDLIISFLNIDFNKNEKISPSRLKHTVHQLINNNHECFNLLRERLALIYNRVWEDLRDMT